MLRSDCKRLLGIDQGATGTSTIKLNCDNVGVCGGWGDEDALSSGALTTPWAVNTLLDQAPKYYSFKDITFTGGTAIVPEQMMTRVAGQAYTGIDPGSTYPGSIADAGIVNFEEGFKVDTEKMGSYVEGVTHFCVAPIVNADGNGGGFYAVGQNCCVNNEFTCNTGDQGVVLMNNLDKYKTAMNALEL